MTIYEAKGREFNDVLVRQSETPRRLVYTYISMSCGCQFEANNLVVKLNPNAPPVRRSIIFSKIAQQNHPRSGALY